MKIAIRKEPNGLIYIDKNLIEGVPYTEPPYNFTIIEVEKDDCEPVDFNDDLTFSLEKYNARQNQFELNNELNELVAWFDNYFAKQLQQSQWQDDFTVSHDEYLDKDYANLDELKVQAKIFRDRIREIKEQLKLLQ